MTTIAIQLDGVTLQARPGETLAATLTAHGIRDFRTTRRVQSRGMFCGMGICEDCLVEVDGRANQRACMIKIDRPMQVRREMHARPLPDVATVHPPLLVDDVAIEYPEFLVIGAGPGGMSAAIAARHAGLEVTVLDERSYPGGQYFKQITAVGPDVKGPDAQHRAGADLIKTALDLGVIIRSGVVVWGAFEPHEFVATEEGRTIRFQPRATLVATGAYERGWPVPGWTLPGVMTTGAAQTLWRTARRLPGRRVLIAGNGPLNLQLAAELIGGGAEVVAVVEAAGQPGWRDAADLLSMLINSPGLMMDGLRYHGRRISGGTPMIHGMVVGSITVSGNGLSVGLRDGDGFDVGRTFEADAVCLGYGFEPSNELLRALGCGHDFDPVSRQLRTRRDDDGRTEAPGIYAVGDCTGLGGAKAALAEGTIVALAVARDLDRPLGADLLGLEHRSRAKLQRHRQFQSLLWKVFAAPGYSAKLASPDTLVCRCEEVTFGQIDAALTEGMRSIGAVKRCTRAGMGRCQGRYCAPVLDTLLTERLGLSRDEYSGFAPRVPIKPISIEDLARTRSESR